MKNVKTNYSLYFKDKTFIISFFISLCILGVALVVNFYAGMYATNSASNAVTDIILSNIPVYNVEGIFVYGPWIFWIFVACIVFPKPYKIPFIIKSIALFVLVRSVFITLTHIGPFPTANIIGVSKLITNFTSGGDLFFSAHTGLPFLIALIFWQDKLLRSIFFITSVFFGVVVLMGHLHYSIDVLAAFFITYSIYHIARNTFKKDEHFFRNRLLEKQL